jgi:hypothetical protein
MSTDLEMETSSDKTNITEPSQAALVRSHSMELPTTEMRAHFDESANIKRPSINRASISHSEGQQQPSSRRPSVMSRRSFAYSVSSFSLYSHFAGERFSNPRHPISRASMDDLSNKRKNSNARSLASYQRGTDSEKLKAQEVESIEDVDSDSPKASVGKAMFMFLKAFIGSGVLFLPKA